MLKDNTKRISKNLFSNIINKNNIKYIFISIIFSLSITIFCQTKVYIVKGKVVGADTNYSMRGANVFLINKKFIDSVSHNKNYKINKDSVYGNVVDKNGNYEIKNVPLGKYVIKCTFIGYKAEVDTIELKGNYSEIIKNFYLKVQPIK
jgi:hypothetical protein